jgi:type I restriction enzyme S subunit
LPSIDEQEKIVGILDLIQRAIRQQDRLIDLTSELKQVLLHKLLNEGITKERLKETHVGKIPESWQVLPLGDCCIVQTGLAKGRKLDPSELITVPYLRVANVQDGYLDLSEIKTISIRPSEKERYLLRVDDVLMTEGGDLDKLGRGFIWRGEIADCIHQNHVFAVRVDRELLEPQFLAYLSQSPYGKAYFLSVAHKTTNLASINTTKLKGLPILVPSLQEQRRIVQVLETVDCRIQVLRMKKDRLTDLFRTLLHHLMTGGIRANELNLAALEGEIVE